MSGGERGTGFAWTVEEFDRQMIPQLIDLLVTARAAKYIAEDERDGVPVRSYAQAEVDELEQLQAERELRVRAGDGDQEAVQQLVDEAARAELACERLRHRNELHRVHRGELGKAEREGREADPESVAWVQAARAASVRLAAVFARASSGRRR